MVDQSFSFASVTEGYFIDEEEETEPEEYLIRLEIYEVYKGEKWKDVCVTDILYTYIN